MFSARLKKWVSDTKSYTGIFGYTNFPLTYYDYYFRHDDAQLSWTRVLTPRMVNEFSFAYTYSDESGGPRGDRTHKEAFRDTYGITLGQLYPASNPYNILPAMSFTGISNPVLFTYDQRTPISAKESFWELTDNLSVNRGNHALKFGVYVHGISTNEGVRANNFSGNLSFDRDPNNPGDTNHPYANALLGNFQSYQEASRKNLAQAKYFVDRVLCAGPVEGLAKADAHLRRAIQQFRLVSLAGGPGRICSGVGKLRSREDTQAVRAGHCEWRSCGARSRLGSDGAGPSDRRVRRRHRRPCERRGDKRRRRCRQVPAGLGGQVTHSGFAPFRFWV